MLECGEAAACAEFTPFRKVDLTEDYVDREPWQTLKLFEDGNPTKSEQVLWGGWFSSQHLQSSKLNLT